MAALLFATPALAQTHLVPEPSAAFMDFQPGYWDVEGHVFAPAFEKDVRAMALVEPSFSPEFAIGVREGAGKYSVFYYVAPDHLWDYAALEMMKKGEIQSSQNGKSTTKEEIAKLQASLPADPASIKLVRCDVPVDPELGKTIIGIWRSVLLQTHYDEKPTFGVDGDIYHFSMDIDLQSLTGQVWSPNEDTDIGRAVGLIYTIKYICTKEHDANIETLSAEASGLANRLQIALPTDRLK